MADLIVTVVSALVLFSTLLFSNAAAAQVTCIKERVARLNDKSLGIAPSDVEDLISQIVRGVGLTPTGIIVVPCDGIPKVQTYNLDRADIPKRDYILYDPVWTREVIGSVAAVDIKSRDQAIVLFGHEIGHILSRHFTSNASLTRLQQETDADHFAGCAAAIMHAKWDSVVELLSRLRGDVDTEYPSRDNSISTAKDGFERCGRPVTKVSSKENTFAPFILRPGDTRNLSVSLPNDGPVDVYIDRINPNLGKAGKKIEGLGLAVRICSAETAVGEPCAHSQIGEGQVARRKLPAGPANISIFNFANNPEVSITMRVAHSQ